MNGLRDYQKKIYIESRDALKINSSACIQLHTGGGKTVIFTAMCESVLNKNKRAWIVVPRKELIYQSSKHLIKWGVNHGMIKPDMQESKAFKIHVVSKDTLIRRYDKIKNWPDLLIFDEAHLYFDRQKEIISHLPETSKTLGFTATPERLDGRGLSEIYNKLIEGPSITWLTERGFLSELKYFAPPLDGIQNLKRKGTEFDEEDLEELLKRKKIYGELVGHYDKHGRGKPALIFCRSVKSAYQTAERFNEKGFNFHCIEGKMPDKKRKNLISALTNGEIDGLTNCEIATYGLDIPRVEYGASIRPTLSRALYFQMIGRILRPFKNKKEALFFDHVNMLLEHQDYNYPGIPPHYIPKINWNFNGTEKRKRNKIEVSPRLCPYIDFMYCMKSSCQTCEHNPDKTIKDCRRPMIVIKEDLKEKEKPKFSDLPFNEKREFQDKINKHIIEYKTTKSINAIEKLLIIAESLGYRELWVYRKLTDENRYTINIPLLSEIAKIKNYKPGWVWFMKKKLNNAR